MLAAADSKARVLGVLSPDRGSGVSTLCRMVAESFACSGVKTLLVDLTQTVVASREGCDWWDWVPGKNVAQIVKLDPGGYEILAARPTNITRALFNNVDTLRQIFNNELSEYKAIVVDLPAVLHQREDHINPVAAARACDAVIMMCVTGRTTKQNVNLTVRELGSAGVQLGGTVLNDFHSPPPRTEKASKVTRFATSGETCFPASPMAEPLSDEICQPQRSSEVPKAVLTRLSWPERTPAANSISTLRICDVAKTAASQPAPAPTTASAATGSPT